VGRKLIGKFFQTAKDQRRLLNEKSAKSENFDLVIAVAVETKGPRWEKPGEKILRGGGA